MGHGKETPRQKMIGMMYLVLTALLALNVQREVLNAFAIVDEGLSKTTKNFVEKNKMEYDIIAAAAAKNKVKGGKWNDVALEVIKRTNEIIEDIDKYRVDLVNLCDGPGNEAVHGKEVHPALVASKDVMDKVAQLMVGDKGDGEAKKLKKKIEALKLYYLSNVDKKYKNVYSSIEKNLETSDPPSIEGIKESWESEHFEHIPLSAVLAIMSGIQSNVRNAESEMIKHLENMLDAGATKFNKLEAAIIPNTNYVMSGNDYEAKIFIAASDSTQRAKVLIGQYEKFTNADGDDDYRMKGSFDSIREYKEGKAIYKVRAGAVGPKKVAGLIQIGSSDDAKHVPFELNYSVGEPAVIVSPIKMNVFYIGVENPVEVSIPGIGGDKIFPSITNGSITKAAKGGYIVKVTKPGSADVTVMADMGGGAKKNMGSKPFRVKVVPDPVAKVAGIKGSGPIKKEILMAQSSVVAELENFDFDIKYKISSFVVSATVNGFDKEVRVQGNQFNDAVIGLVKTLSKSQKLYFQDIWALGPDNNPRKLGSIILTLN